LPTMAPQSTLVLPVPANYTVTSSSLVS